MFNLLPQNEQRALALEYRLRLLIVALFALLFIGALAGGALIPSLFLSSQREDIALKNEEALKGEITLQSKYDLTNILKLAKLKANALVSDSGSPYLYEMFGQIIKDKTSAIKINGLSARVSSPSDKTIAVMGIARDRDSLVSFTKTLELEHDFDSVLVPVSNFAESMDIVFSIIVKLK